MKQSSYFLKAVLLTSFLSVSFGASKSNAAEICNLYERNGKNVSYTLKEWSKKSLFSDFKKTLIKEFREPEKIKIPNKSPKLVVDDKAIKFLEQLQSPSIRSAGMLFKAACSQSEFTKSLKGYLSKKIEKNSLFIRQGKGEVKGNSRVLSKVVNDYLIPESVPVTIWGLESAYGENTGHSNIIESLFYLTYFKYREDFNKRQLAYAFTVLKKMPTSITKSNLEGSWAGGMGHGQFIPETYARVFEGTNPFNLDSSLYSIANLLKKDGGWKPRIKWGYLVDVKKFNLLKDKINYWKTITAEKDGKPVSRKLIEWQKKLGLKILGKRVRLKGNGMFQLLVPMGERGPKFLVSKNFYAVREYNKSTSYALSVLVLSDIISGDERLRFNLDRIFNSIKEDTIETLKVKKLQFTLLNKGFFKGLYSNDKLQNRKHRCEKIVDGKPGGKTNSAVRAYQLKNKLLPDGYINESLYKQVYINPSGTRRAWDSFISKCSKL